MGVIACCLLERSVLVDCIDLGLRDVSFFKETHKAIFGSLMALSVKNEDQDINEIELLDDLRAKGLEDEVGGIAAIYAIQNAVETTAHYKYFARRVLETYNQRQLIRTCREAIEACCDQSQELPDITTKLEGAVRKINDSFSGKSDIVEVEEVVDELRADIIERLENPDKATSLVTTPLSDLNEVLPDKGFLPGDIVVLAARPSVGKTSLAINIAEKTAVDNRVPTLIFSLEMSTKKLASRAACSRSRIDPKQLSDGILSTNRQKQFDDALNDIQSAPITFFKYNFIDIHKLCANARYQANQLARSGQKLGLIVIDYLQLIQSVDKKIIREQQIAEMSRSLKALAGELKLPILVLSQLNRTGEKDGRKPRLSDLRESGAIEQDADIVLLLHRPDQRDYNGDAYPDPNVEVLQVLHAKVRNGPVGEIEATFLRNYTRFENYQRKEII